MGAGQRVDVAIIGAGQAGLSMSRCLAALGIDHVVLERGSVGERWKSATWDSLRMLTPNWMNGLPWQPYHGDDPHGFMTRTETIAALERYAASAGAPVVTRAPVLALEPNGEAFRIVTPCRSWRARAVVIATGQCDRPGLPQGAAAMPGGVVTLHAAAYRAPSSVPDGRVLVVGSSPSGLQIAEELQRAGREVVLSVGRHTRLPRRWRGHDILWWLTRLGKFAERARDMADLEAEKRQPNMQLAGRPDRSDCDLPSLQALGVRLAGRFLGVEAGSCRFASDLAETVATADIRMARILAGIDRFAGIAPAEPVRFTQLRPGKAVGPCLDLAGDRIRAVIWATGYRRAFPWIRLPILDAAGELQQREGVTPIPGVFTLGYRFQCKRDSHFFGGVGSDAIEISGRIARHLGAATAIAA